MLLMCISFKDFDRVFRLLEVGVFLLEDMSKEQQGEAKKKIDTQFLSRKKEPVQE